MDWLWYIHIGIALLCYAGFNVLKSILAHLKQPTSLKQLKRMVRYIGLEVKKTATGLWYVCDPNYCDATSFVVLSGRSLTSNPTILLHSFLATNVFLIIPKLPEKVEIIKNPFYKKTDEEIEILLDLATSIT